MCLLKLLLIGCSIIIILIVKSNSAQAGTDLTVKNGNHSEQTVPSNLTNKELRSGKTLLFKNKQVATRKFIPPVQKPKWDSPVPKFNALIFKRSGNKETPSCSGALITRRCVLTVGTGCVLMGHYRPHSPDDLLVRVHSYLPGTNQVLTYDMGVKQLTVHPGLYTSRNYLAHNDIVIIQFIGRVNFDTFMNPARLPKRNILYHPAVHELWDLTNYHPFHQPVDYNDAVWFVQTRVISTDVCNISLPEGYYKLKMTCASYEHEEMEHCSTDVGSPISYQGELIGLLLYRQHECGAPNSTAMFVNVGLHIDWILEQVQYLYGWRAASGRANCS